MTLQHLMSGWLFKYNLKCQSIDYSEDDHARRVSFLGLHVIRFVSGGSATVSRDHDHLVIIIDEGNAI